MRRIIVDGDFIAYRCAASCEPTKTRLVREERFVALGRANDLCNRIGDSTQAEEYRIFLGGSGNFRRMLDPNYKANRVHQPKPLHLDAVRDHMVRKWGAEIITANYEADDRIAMEAARSPESLIVSIDKDLRQITGEHYNPVKDIYEVVDSEQAEINLYISMLVGDASDNLRGIDGLGPVKAGRALSGCTAKEAYLETARIYEEHGRDFLFALRMFRLLRSEEEYQEVMNEIEQRKSEGEKLAEVGEGPVPEALSEVDTE